MLEELAAPAAPVPAAIGLLNTGRFAEAEQRWVVAISHAQRAEILQKQGNLEGAVDALLSAWNRARDLPVRESSAPIATAIFLIHLFLSHKLFDETTARGQAGTIATAKQLAGFQKRAIRLGERLLRVIPQDTNVRALLESTYLVLATLLDRQGNRRAARRLRRKRRALHRRPRSRSMPAQRLPPDRPWARCGAGGGGATVGGGGPPARGGGGCKRGVSARVV